ncbi:hypothetical protein ACFLZN_00910 [Nanoarchaeota archaeon]
MLQEITIESMPEWINDYLRRHFKEPIDAKAENFWNPFREFFDVNGISLVAQEWKGPYAINTEDYPGRVFEVESSLQKPIKLFLVARDLSPPYENSSGPELEVIAMSPKLRPKKEEVDVFVATISRIGAQTFDSGQIRRSRKYKPPFTEEVPLESFKPFLKVPKAYHSFASWRNRYRQAQLDWAKGIADTFDLE